MKTLFHIDNIQLAEEDNGLNLHIVGWYAPENYGQISYGLKVDGKLIALDYKMVKREDVAKELAGDNVKAEVGFDILTQNPFNTNTSQFEFFVKDGDNEVSLLLLDKAGIKELFESQLFNYNVDNVEKCAEDGKTVYYVTGWAVLKDTKDEVVFSVRDNSGKTIKSEYTKKLRPDLVNCGIAPKNQELCGFEIKYFSEAEDDVLVITTRNNAVKEEVDIKEFIIRNKKAQKKLVHQQMLKNFNATNVKRLTKYVLKHGFKDIKQKMLNAMAEESDSMHYQDWFNRHKVTLEELARQKDYKFDYEPKISILVPTYNTPIDFLHQMIDSVVNQSYQNWQLCIGEGSQGNKELEAVLEEYHKNDSRVVYKVLEKNEGISGNTNGALAIADGDFIGLLDHDDLMEPDALFEVVKRLQKDTVDIVYTDEDKVVGDTLVNCDPNFKPDFSMDLFRSHNYITHFFCVRKSIVDEIGGFRSEFDGSQDYDLMFRCIEKSRDIEHVPKILYHWRMCAGSTAENPESKMYCYDAGKRAIEGHLERMGIKGRVEHVGLWGMYHVIYDTPGNPLISIVIPNKDHTDDLDLCIRSIIDKSAYRNFEFVVVENNSTDDKTFEYYEKIQKEFDCVKVVYWDREFNYSAINNFGVENSNGDYILLLNNDTELIGENSLSDMLGICMRDEVGVVGAKLLFDDDTVQHAGIVIGFGGFAGHVFSGIGRDDYGYMVRARINCNYSAVTAACLMTKRSVFDEVGGLTEEFVVALNDVDYCLKVREKNYLVVYDAFSLWYHYESKSRGYEDTPEKQARFQGEVKKFQDRWAGILEEGDPYYNKNFPVTIAPFTLD